MIRQYIFPLGIIYLASEIHVEFHLHEELLV